MLRAIVVSITLVGLIGCKPPTGKDEYRRNSDLRNQTLRDCANGTHPSSRECVNAQDVKDLDDLNRSL